MRTRTLLFVAAFCLLPSAPIANTAWARGLSTCVPTDVGIDTSKATTSGELILGMAWGQTFLATDTLVRSVTVWRIASEHNDPSPLKFWITEVDTLGMPHTHLVVYDGPTLSITSPDSTVPTKLEYDFDPPISLPKASTYCFWFQEVCTGYADLLIDQHDEYSGGQIWETYRSNLEGCILRDYPRTIPSDDLVFTIEFCDSSTPARPSTWGRLKVTYR